MRRVAVIILLLFAACHKERIDIEALLFDTPVHVTLSGYTGNSMEPFLSRDGEILFFNNLNSAPENTNLHWSTRINDSTFQYQGELGGVNTDSLEAVPTMDTQGNFFFVSDRHYKQTLGSVFIASYAAGVLTGIREVPNLSKNLPGWINFDVEVSADGNTLFTVDGRYDQFGGPYESDFVIATKSASGFQRAANSTILQNVNSSALEYAAGISADDLMLYFTRVDTPLTSTSVTQLFVATRKDATEDFGIPQHIAEATGFVEAPTVAPDGKRIYYHKKENSKFVICMIRRR